MNQQSFAIRYDAGFVPLANITGTGPRQTSVTVTSDELQVRMGRWFHAEIPRSSIRNAARLQEMRLAGLALPSWGIHTNLRGTWSVNGSLSGLVSLDVQPPAVGHMFGFPVGIKRLVLSLEDPDGFLRALGYG
jgi:hypothetical protein